MKMRKIISLLLALVMVCAAIPFTALAEGAAVNEADFNTIVTSNANGDSGYTKTYTTTNGWTTVNCAIQTGGANDVNPQYKVIGPDNTHKAVCMNGKTSAPGKITSPTLTGGISKLTVNYTKMFTDTDLSATVTITDKATSETYTKTIARTEAKDTKYVVWTEEWVLDTPITGEFTIEIVNNCPTKQDSNKDRMTILGVSWESAAEEPAPETPAEPKEATITFDNTAKRTELTTMKQVWVENGITVTNEKSASTTNVADYSNPARFYAGSSLKIEFAGMTKVTVTCNTSSYATALVNSLTANEGITVTADGKVVTIVFDEAVDSLVIEKLSAQVRVDEITVTAAASETPETPEPEVPETPEEPEVPEATEATIIFDNTAKRTEFTTEKQIWVENGITVTNEKSASTSNVADYSNPARFYAGSSLKIEFAGMTKLAVTCNSASYADALANSLAANEGITVTADGKVVTIVFDEAVDSLVIEKLAAQVRVNSMTAYTGNASTPETPEEPENPVLPTTPEEIVNAAYALGTGEALEGTYTLTGVITSVNTPYDSYWGNVTVTIVVGDMTDKPIQCFRMKGDGADIIGVGDTITVTGTLKNYNGTVEFDAGCNLDSYVKAETPETPETPEEPETPAYAVVDTPVAGTAYKFGMVQANIGNKIYYLAGGMSSYYMATTEDVNAAIDVYLEETTGGYYLYTIENGAKVYINMVVSGTYVNAAYEDAASTVYTYDAEKKTVIAEIDGVPYWHGTRNDNTYTTVGPMKVEYEGFYCQFYAKAVNEEPETPETPETPDVSPETGDFAIVALAAVMVMSGSALVLLKKKEF